MRPRNHVFLLLLLEQECSLILTSILLWCSLGGGRLELNRRNLDTTDALARLEADFDVAVIAPGVSPRVLDQEVLHIVLDAVADN